MFDEAVEDSTKDQGQEEKDEKGKGTQKRLADKTFAFAVAVDRTLTHIVNYRIAFELWKQVVIWNKKNWATVAEEAKRGTTPQR